MSEYFHDYRQHYGEPRTFHMDSLLQEIKHIDGPSRAIQPQLRARHPGE